MLDKWWGVFAFARTSKRRFLSLFSVANSLTLLDPLHATQSCPILSSASLLSTCGCHTFLYFHVRNACNRFVSNGAHLFWAWWHFSPWINMALTPSPFVLSDISRQISFASRCFAWEFFHLLLIAVDWPRLSRRWDVIIRFSLIFSSVSAAAQVWHLNAAVDVTHAAKHWHYASQFSHLKTVVSLIFRNHSTEQTPFAESRKQHAPFQ